jgi:hypothetical protein
MNFLCPFTNITICNNIPNTEYKPSWLGTTGYLNSVRPNDDVFKDSSVVKFIDNYSRSAIAIKYNVQCPESEAQEYSVVAFQRYTGSETPWVYGGHFARDAATQIGPINNTWAENLLKNNHETFPIYNSDDVCIVSISGNSDTTLVTPDL